MCTQRSTPSLAVFLVAISLAACGYKRDELPAPPVSEAGPAYVIQPGDWLNVKFYNNPDLNESVVVRPDGVITLQVIGEVPVAGRQPSELTKELEQMYAEELAKPKIAVIVRRLGAYRVYVGGQVKEPRAVPLRASMTVFQAIQEAGGLIDTSNDKVVLIRRSPDGEPVGYLVELDPITNGSDPSKDVYLSAADIVHVPRSGIADANLVVEQYIRNMLPVEAGVALPVW